MISNGRHWGSY